ncbi:MAG TPA: lipopolysaccharide biosynthesis protein [Pyrinomonadaceae bacterium]|nr:lipopolysaccharide biosynthesis protein [Pyrinomonadaceae bacterium]
MTDEATGRDGSLTARASWLMLARTAAFALGFAVPLLLVRILSQTELGLYRQVFLVVATAINVLPLGFHMSAFYFLPRERGREGQVALNVALFFLLVAALAGGAVVLFPGLLAATFNSAALVPYAPAIGAALFLWVASTNLEYVALANQEVKLATVLIVALQLARSVMLLAAALAFGTVGALLWAAVAYGAVQTAVLVAYLARRFRIFSCGFDWPLMRRQLAYAVPLGAAGLLYALQLDLHQYFVANRFGEAAFAVYSIGCFQLPLIHILSDSVGAVMLPRVTRLQKENRARKIVELTARMMRKLAVVYFAAYAFLLVAGREFIAVLFTEQYLASHPVFVVNLTMILVYFMSNVYDPIMRAYAEQRYFLLRLRLALVALLVAVLWWETERLGLVGVITVAVGLSLAERIITAARAASVVGATWRDAALLKDVGRVALAALAAAVVTLLARSLAAGARPFVVLVVCAAVFAPVYVACVWLFGAVTAEEREMLARKAALLRRAAPRGRRAPGSVF